ELGPDLVFLGAGDMAIGAFPLGFHFGRCSLWFVMIEIVVPPTSGIGVALRILDRHICAIKRSGKITPTGKLCSRTIRHLPRQRELQLLEEDGPFRKFIRLLVNLV